MKVDSLACNNCGAPLEVAETTKFATCTHCGSRLSITRTGGAAYTEVLAQIGQHTKQMSGDLSAIRLHTELDRLDRNAQEGRMKWQSHLNDIAATVEGVRKFDKGPLVAFVELSVGFIVFMAMLTSNVPTGGWVVALIFIVIGSAELRRSRGHARKHNDWKQYYQKQQQLFSDAEQVYNAKRADIIRRLDHL